MPPSPRGSDVELLSLLMLVLSAGWSDSPSVVQSPSSLSDAKPGRRSAGSCYPTIYFAFLSPPRTTTAALHSMGSAPQKPPVPATLATLCHGFRQCRTASSSACSRLRAAAERRQRRVCIYVMSCCTAGRLQPRWTRKRGALPSRGCCRHTAAGLHTFDLI